MPIGRRLTDDQRYQIWELRRAGKTFVEIGRIVHCSKQAASAYYRKRSLRLKRTSHHVIFEVDVETERAIISMAEDWHTQREIAKRFGINTATVSHYCKKHQLGRVNIQSEKALMLKGAKNYASCAWNVAEWDAVMRTPYGDDIAARILRDLYYASLKMKQIASDEPAQRGRTPKASRPTVSMEVLLKEIAVLYGPEVERAYATKAYHLGYSERNEKKLRLSRAAVDTNSEIQTEE